MNKCTILSTVIIIVLDLILLRWAEMAYSMVLDINDTINIFYENVYKIINAYCPVKTVYLSNYPHWFSVVH